MSVSDIARRLESLDLDQLRASALADIRSGKKTRRQKGVKLLRAVDGMQRNKVRPSDLLITRVPVIPPAFRPYTMAGDTFIPGDANELYSDLIKAVDIHRENSQLFGDSGSPDTARYVRQAVKAAYGYDDSPNPKIKSRKVSGFLTKILGSNPKSSWVSSKLLAKPQDFVGRGVISPDPELTMDEVGVPEDMAWELFDAHVRRSLTAQGIPVSRALQMMKDRHPIARRTLETEMREKPVIYSRAPSWHRHNVISGYAKMRDGHNITISPLITAGVAGDFDGDTMSMHSPMLPEAIKDAREKILPSKMLFSVRSRDSTLPQPKHEMIGGLANAQLNPSGTVHRFGTKDEALAGIKAGQVKLHDQVEIGPPIGLDQPPAAPQTVADER